MSDGAVKLYNLNYLYGYLSSGLAYLALCRLFPARGIDSFTRQPVTAGELQQSYRDRWDSDRSSLGDVGRDGGPSKAGEGNAEERVPTTA